jgi:hypothetical protein
MSKCPLTASRPDHGDRQPALLRVSDAPDAMTQTAALDTSADLNLRVLQSLT